MPNPTLHTLLPEAGAEGLASFVPSYLPLSKKVLTKVYNVQSACYQLAAGRMIPKIYVSRL